jgi:hypothetical protein
MITLSIMMANIMQGVDNSILNVALPSQVKLMKPVGIPADRICKTITNPRTRKSVAPMTLARAFTAEREIWIPRGGRGIMLTALEKPLPETASERPPGRPRHQYS